MERYLGAKNQGIASKVVNWTQAYLAERLKQNLYRLSVAMKSDAHPVPNRCTD